MPVMGKVAESHDVSYCNGRVILPVARLPYPFLSVMQPLVLGVPLVDLARRGAVYFYPCLALSGAYLYFVLHLLVDRGEVRFDENWIEFRFFLLPWRRKKISRSGLTSLVALHSNRQLNDPKGFRLYYVDSNQTLHSLYPLMTFNGAARDNLNQLNRDLGLELPAIISELSEEEQHKLNSRMLGKRGLPLHELNGLIAFPIDERITIDSNGEIHLTFPAVVPFSPYLIATGLPFALSALALAMHVFAALASLIIFGILFVWVGLASKREVVVTASELLVRSTVGKIYKKDLVIAKRNELRYFDASKTLWVMTIGGPEIVSDSINWKIDAMAMAARLNELCGLRKDK